MRIISVCVLSWLLYSHTVCAQSEPQSAESTASTPSPVESLKQGLFEEEANHNLEKAAEHYRAAIKGKQQAVQVAGTATYRLAEVMLKLGKKEDAINLYQQVMQEYPQQKSLLPLATKRLEELKAKPIMMEEEVASDAMSDLERALIEQVEAQLKVNPDYFFAIGQDNEPSPATKAIFDAAHKGYCRALTVLVQGGVPVESQLSPSRQTPTPLHQACQAGHVKACETLLDLGADLHGEGESGGWTAIHYASAWGRPEVIKFLVSNKGAKINSQIERVTQDRYLNVPTGTALHLAARDDYPRSVEMLLALGAYVNAVTSVGQTPLMTAARNDRTEVVKVLLAAGANMELQFNADPQKGQTALHDAAWFGAKGAAQLLLENGANPNARKAEGTEGYTPLHHTAIRDCFEVAKLLVKHGAEVKAKDFDGNTALHLALQKGSVASDAYVVWLLDQGLDPMQPNAKGEMPIYLATGSRVELIAKNWFYKQWAAKRAVSLVRRGSFVPAGGLAAPNESATPPNLDAYLKLTLGPNYEQRSSVYWTGGGIKGPHSIFIWRVNDEGKLASTEVKVHFVPGESADKLEPALKAIELKWHDIVEIDPKAYLPPLSIEDESKAIMQAQRWLSAAFPDNERDNVPVRVQLESTGEGQAAKVKASYFNAETGTPIPTIIDGKSFAWSLEEVAGQRWLRVVIGDQPSINDMVFSYSLDGDSLGLMRLRRTNQPKASNEPPFQSGTLRFQAMK